MKCFSLWNYGGLLKISSLERNIGNSNFNFVYTLFQNSKRRLVLLYILVLASPFPMNSFIQILFFIIVPALNILFGGTTLMLFCGKDIPKNIFCSSIQPACTNIWFYEQGRRFTQKLEVRQLIQISCLYRSRRYNMGSRIDGYISKYISAQWFLNRWDRLLVVFFLTFWKSEQESKVFQSKCAQSHRKSK